MNKLGWIRRAEGWAQEELGAQGRLKEALEGHLEDLIAGGPEAVESSGRTLAERTEECERRSKRLRVLLGELGEALGETPPGLSVAARALGTDASGLLDLASELRGEATDVARLTRRVVWLANKQASLVNDLLATACGLEPGTDLDQARGKLVDGLA